MIDQSHFLSRRIAAKSLRDRQIQAVYATAPAGKAVVFIHGFSGHPTKTWLEFPLLGPSRKELAGWDMFFYGYNGVRADMYASASLLRKFLDELFTNTAEFTEKFRPPIGEDRKALESYEEVVIVAHSLGAVLTRRALLDALKLKSSWPAKVRLLLFAPAHMGAIAKDLAVVTASSIPFVRWFVSLVRFASPLIDQLGPESKHIERLLSETEEHCSDGQHDFLIAKKVIIAEFENIVSNLSFASDPPGTAIMGTSHTSVCKPAIRQSEALLHLLKVL